MDTETKLTSLRNVLIISTVFLFFHWSLDLTDAKSCGGKRCGFGTRTDWCRYTRSQTDCACLNNYWYRKTYWENTDRLQFCTQECPDGVCLANYTCYGESSSSKRCYCAEGFSRSNATGDCVDINECRVDRPCDVKNNTICTNTMGSFVCACLSGYNTSEFNTSCHDTNECIDGRICDDKNNTVCKNTMGSFVCACLSGFNTSEYNTSCHDINECIDDKSCDDKNNTVCKNNMGSFVCECLSGYNTSIYNDSCRDIDECEENYSVCEEHSVCENLPGNYSCQRLAEYTLSTVGNSTCISVAADALTDPKGNTSVGVYVGVTFGTLVLLSLITVGVLVRRRRNRNKSGEETRQISHRNNKEHTMSNTAYENVKLENENQDLPSNNHDIKTVFKYPENKLSRRQNAISVEYSNVPIPPRNKRIENTPALQNIVGTGESEVEGMYSALYGEQIIPKHNSVDNTKFLSPLVHPKMFDDPNAYTTLDVLTLNSKDKPNTKGRMDDEKTPTVDPRHVM